MNQQALLIRCSKFLLSFFAMLLAIAGSYDAGAQTLSGEALLKALQKGGNVIVMRHASAPRAVPDKQTANPDNTTPERQLDEAGRNTATAMGKAFRDLKIPVGEVLSSPTYRARETIKLAGFGAPKTFAELGDGGQSMQALTEIQFAWLRNKTAERPKASTNTIIVTHMPNMSGAFPQSTVGLADGEALVFSPDGKGGASMIARIKIEDWPKLGK